MDEIMGLGCWRVISSGDIGFIKTVKYYIYTYNILRKYSEPSSLTLHQILTTWFFGPLSHLRYRPTSRCNPTAPPQRSCHPPDLLQPHVMTRPSWRSAAKASSVAWRFLDHQGFDHGSWRESRCLNTSPRFFHIGFSPFLQWRNQASHLETVKPWPFPTQKKRSMNESSKSHTADAHP